MSTKNRERIREKLIEAGCTPAGAAAVLGNLYAESGYDPANLENTYNSKWGITDQKYTAEVDAGSRDFIYDAAGYGLAQWTYYTRKRNLLAEAKRRNVSVSDLDLQIDYLVSELKSGYRVLWDKLCSASTPDAAAVDFMVQFERPADVSDAAKNKRVKYAQDVFADYTDRAAQISVTITVDGKTYSGTLTAD